MPNFYKGEGISVLPAAAKTLTKITLECIKEYLETIIDKNPAGFRFRFLYDGRTSTVEIIGKQRQEFRSTLNLLFVEFEKAFESVTKECIWNV